MPSRTTRDKALEAGQEARGEKETMEGDDQRISGGCFRKLMGFEIGFA